MISDWNQRYIAGKPRERRNGKESISEKRRVAVLVLHPQLGSTGVAVTPIGSRLKVLHGELVRAKIEELVRAKIEELVRAKIEELVRAGIEELVRAGIEELVRAEIEELVRAEDQQIRAGR